MRRIAFIYFIATFSTFCIAETVSYESVRVAENLTERTWENFNNVIPMISTQVEQKLRSDGFSENTAQIYSEELKRSINKDNITKAIAKVLSDKFNDDELKELSAFLNSDIGKRYTKLSNDLGSEKYFTPILKQACNAAIQRLDSSERSNMIRECSSLK